MGLEFEDGMQSIGRFDVVERGDGRLRLSARARSDTHTVRWARWVVGVFVVVMPAFGGAMWGGVAVAFFLGLTGMTFAILVMIDFSRVSTEGTFFTVEHRFELETSTPESYRSSDKAGSLVVDDRRMALPVRDVRVLAQSVPRTGEEVCRVYVILDGIVIVLESTKNRATALRLASLVRSALALPRLAGVVHEMAPGAGCAWSALFFLIALTAPFVLAPIGMTLVRSPSYVAVLGLALVVGLVALEHAFAIPMRASVREYIERHLKT